jgi:hypothetical protein
MKSDPQNSLSKRSPKPTCPVGRRSFLKKSLAASVAAPLIMSMEEHALVVHGETASAAAASGSASNCPMGTIGSVKISRLICGGNLISGYAHSRDLIYVSNLLRAYFTDEKIMETWAMSEQHGINTMIAYPGDPRAVKIYQKYRAKGGRIQYLAQLNPEKQDLKTCVDQAVDAGASGAFLLGNIADDWARQGEVGRIGELISYIKSKKLISGVAGHELRVPTLVEQARIEPDFYMKTLHHKNYWSSQQPDQTKDVIDNYSIDNYWCMDPDKTIAFMKAIRRPWIAYKVLAAGAIRPEAGFRYAFEHGADFVCVGMFDFQIAQDVKVTSDMVRVFKERERPWMA